MTLPEGMPLDWPLRDASRVVAVAHLRWHLQVLGAGETVLLLHGAGGATHSWRGLAPLLAPHFHVVMVDLPGQGFTRSGRRDRFGLDAMAEDIAALCAGQGWHPVAVIGHSAGGAIALRLAEIIALRAVVGINAALGQFDGLAGFLFPVLARALSVAPFVPSLFARLSGTTQRVTSLIGSTGSDIGPEGIELYRRLVARPEHVEATLGMMAQWRLDGLLDRLPRITTPTLLIAATGDRTVPPAVSSGAAGRLPAAEYASLQGGHLVQEETPQAVADAILPFLARHLRD